MTAPVCAACGTAVRPEFRAPRPESAPDLDMRPGEPARSTLRHWIRVCDGCGAAAPDLTTLPANTADIVRSAAYRDCDGSPQTKPFRLWAILFPSAAPDAFLHAAWAADDAGETEEAASLRKLAAAHWPANAPPEQALRKLDILRRAGAFDEAGHFAAQLRGDDIATEIVTFQKSKIAARDSGRYAIGAALRPPANAPHVSHGKKPRTGLLSRLLNRQR